MLKLLGNRTFGDSGGNALDQTVTHTVGHLLARLGTHLTVRTDVSSLCAHQSHQEKALARDASVLLRTPMGKTPLNRFTIPLASVIVNYGTARFRGACGLDVSAKLNDAMRDIEKHNPQPAGRPVHGRLNPLQPTVRGGGPAELGRRTGRPSDYRFPLEVSRVQTFGHFRTHDLQIIA